jgi:hypothetical protein
MRHAARSSVVGSARRARVQRFLAGAVALLVVLAPVSAAGPARAAVPAASTTVHTVTYQCDPAKPGYGTNSTGGVYFDAFVGDTVEITAQGGSCRAGGMHVMGEKSQISWSPANDSCCSYIPSGTTYRVSILNKDTGSNGGWVNIPFFGTNYAGIEHVRFKILASPQPPAAPTDLAAVPGETELRLSFTQGDLSDQPLLRNEVQVDGGPWRTLPDDNVVTGLTPDTDYTIRVRAVTSLGEGRPSDATQARTLAQVSGVTATYVWQCDPSLPGYGTRTPGTDPVPAEIGDRLLLKFNGTGCLTGDMHIRGDATQIVLQPKLATGCCTRIPSGTTMVLDVVSSTGRNGDPGWVALPFFNNGLGLIADLDLRIANPAPAAPVITSATRVGKNIVIEFTQVQPKAPITGYEFIFDNSSWGLYWADSFSAVPGRQITSPLTIPATFGADSAHFFKLRAVNSAGPGGFATGEALATLTRPGAPTNDRAEPGDGQVVYSWDPATPGSAPIKEYEVQVYSYAPRSKLIRTIRTTSTQVTVSGLVNGVKHEFYATAFDADGERGNGTGGVLAVPNRAPVVVDICHAADGEYQRIAITFDPVKGDAHYSHGGDIIPPVAGRAGLNWDEKGTAIYANNCVEEPLVDTDADGIVDLEDADDDGDGVLDVADGDDDGDGTPDSVDVDEPMKSDVDGDGVPNALDPDDDGDGIVDVVDADSDGDRVDDSLDSDVVQPIDTDRDGTPDAVDPDDDGDCIADARDSDRDGDGVRDSRDSDLDNDGVPNALDVDDDGDGLADAIDADANADGSNDAIEADEASESGSVRASRGAKLRSDSCEVVIDDNVDTDGDGVPNSVDRDDDGDGVPDATDSDDDGDGIANVDDGDSDGDGIVNTEDSDTVGLTNPAVVDTDGDGVPDSRDKDDDGDGVPDVRDGDADGDGKPETSGQALSGEAALPTAVPANGNVVLLSDGGRTNAHQRAVVTVECRADLRAHRSRPAGDVSGSHLRSCSVKRSGDKVVLAIHTAAPTKVTVRISAPATGSHLRYEEVRRYSVG